MNLENEISSAIEYIQTDIINKYCVYNKNRQDYIGIEFRRIADLEEKLQDIQCRLEEMEDWLISEREDN